jgi:hypothetical protein
MSLPAANFPLAPWDGNEQNTTNDGDPDPALAQARDYNLAAAEIVALETFLLSGAHVFRAINRTGGTLEAGRFVGVTGRDATTGLPTIGYAQAASGVNARTAAGILPEAVADGDAGWVRRLGLYGPLDTSAGAAEGVIWLDSSGGGNFLLVPPAWPIRVQRLGRIAVVGDADHGYLWIEPEEANDLRSVTQRLGPLAGSDDRFLFAAPFKCHVVQVTLVSDTATSGSNGGDNWSFQLRNLTAANNLRATVKSTNGIEIGGDEVYSLDPDQNLKVSWYDVIELQVTKTGNPTSLAGAEIMVQVEFVPDTDD